MNAQLQRRALHLAIIPCHSNTHIEPFILDVYLWFFYVLNVKHRNTNKPYAILSTGSEADIFYTLHMSVYVVNTP